MLAAGAEAASAHPAFGTIDAITPSTAKPHWHDESVQGV
jgi:hypothetical protein